MAKRAKPIFFDVETQSAIGIEDPAYIGHPSTRMLTFQWLDGKQFGIWINPSVPQPTATQVKKAGFNVYHTTPLPALVPKRLYIAHNCEMFDARIVERFIPSVVKHGIQWGDTIHQCRLHGLPGSLNAVSEAFGIGSKADDKVLMEVTKAKYVKGKLCYNNPNGAQWGKLLEYCYEDCRLLGELSDKLEQFDMTSLEKQIQAAHWSINDRGYKIDTDYAEKLIALWERIGEDSRKELAKITKGKLTGDAIRSPQKVKAYLATIGLDLRTLDKRFVDRLIDGEIAISDVPKKQRELVLQVLTLRKLANRSSTGKITAFLERSDKNGVVKHSLQYGGAHTLRWSGRGAQPHNIAKPVEKLNANLFATSKGLEYRIIDAEAKRLCKETKQTVSTADVLSSLTRGVIIPRAGYVLGIGDYSQIEARGVAYFSDCSRLLKLYSGGGDVYLDFGSDLFGRRLDKDKDKRERFIAKQIVLGCCYQMGGSKFDAMALQFRINLESVNLTGNLCVKKYREAFPEVPRLWRRMQEAAISAVQSPGKVYSGAWCIDFYCDGAQLEMHLPSGRILRYWNPSVNMEFPTKFESNKPIPHLRYISAYGYTMDLYGGKLTENAVQASMRDVLAEGMVRLETEIPTVLHVHDEAVTELKNSKLLKRQCELMSIVPEWCPDFPLAVEGFTAERYGKIPCKGATFVEATNGKVTHMGVIK